MAASKPSPHPAPEAPAGAADGAAAHPIWLAGLGAMAQAQAQGTKAFETLVSDGLAFQRKSQEQARAQLQEATERLSHLAQGLQPAAPRVDRLEHLFEDRVAKALQRLGMPSMQDVVALQARVAALEAQLAALGAKPAPARKRSPKA